MAAGNLRGETGKSEPPSAKVTSVPPQYKLTLVDSSFFLVSLIRQIRERLSEPARDAITAAPVNYNRGEAILPLTEMLPWYRDLPNQIKALFEKPKSPPVPITSHPIPVREIWHDFEQQPVSWLNSALVHALVILALTLPFVLSRPRGVIAKTKDYTIIYAPYIPDLPEGDKKSGGGGGGGDRSPTPASEGAISKFAHDQLAPPQVKPLEFVPKLAVTPALIGQPELQLPPMRADTNWGDPTSALSQLSGGPGFEGGIGPGRGSGIGPGKGPGYGPGEDGNTGGGPPVYGYNSDISAPKEIFSPAPDYSEEARKAKLQGIVLLSLVVDAEGNPTQIRVVKPLGMGLDEKAVEKISKWRFIPAKRNGVPVPVRVTLEITFRLF